MALTMSHVAGPTTPAVREMTFGDILRQPFGRAAIDQPHRDPSFDIGFYPCRMAGHADSPQFKPSA